MLHKVAFPLHEYFNFYKTCSGPVRFVCAKRWQDIRFLGTPVQFKFKWAVQKTLGMPTPGVATFSITANVGHVGMANGALRWNTEYKRWVAEQQLEQIVAVKEAIQSFPCRPLRQTHRLSGVPHPLREWSDLPTLMPVVQNAQEVDGEDGGDEDDEDEDDEDSEDDSDDAVAEHSACYS